MARKNPKPIPNWRTEFPPTVVEHSERIAASRRLPVDRMFDGSADEEVIHARWELIFWLRSGGRSYPQIGRMLGIHHSTVIHAVSKFKDEPDEGHTGGGDSVHRGIGREFARQRETVGDVELA